MKLLIATTNTHKLKEILAIFSVEGLQLLSLRDFTDAPEVVEDGDTFDANARLKASTMAIHAGIWTLADDSGLEVDVLNGSPGVISARYAGEPPDDARNNSKLLAELGQMTNRSARFRCVLALSDSRGTCETVEGHCEGRISKAECGKNGFGYDSLFMPTGYTKTFGELEPAVKNGMSHRFCALQRARDEWAEIFRNGYESWRVG